MRGALLFRQQCNSVETDFSNVDQIGSSKSSFTDLKSTGLTY
jgi:hypothetical protein